MRTVLEPTLQQHCLPEERECLLGIPWGCWLLWVPLGFLVELCLCLVQCWVTTSLPPELPHVGAQPGVVGLVQVQGWQQFPSVLSSQWDQAG